MASHRTSDELFYTPGSYPTSKNYPRVDTYTGFTGNNPSAEIDRLCPSCKQHPETPEHFLRCDAPNRNPCLTSLRNKLVTLFTTHRIDPHVYQMWWLGLTTLNHHDAHKIDQYPPSFHPIFQSQSQIGWKQLYYGRITKQWSHFFITNHPEIDATKFFAKTLQIVWTHVLDLWKLRNTDQTLATAELPPHMWSDINGIYAAKDRLPQPTQDRIFTLMKEELVLKPKPYIQAWITNSTNYIRNKLKILNQQQRLNTQDIQQFSYRNSPPLP